MSEVITNVNAVQLLPIFVYLSPNSIYIKICHDENMFFHALNLSNQKTAVSVTQLISNRISHYAKNNQKLKLILILADELVLYSEQTFPIGLSQAEIDEFVNLKLQQRNQDLNNETYFDYFLLEKAHGTSRFALFEARKDIISKALASFESFPIFTEMIIPQSLLLINHIMTSNHIDQANYHILFYSSSQLVLAQISGHKLIQFEQQQGSSNPQFLSPFTPSETRAVYLVALTPEDEAFSLLKTQLVSNAQLIHSEHFVSLDQMIESIFSWTKEQYDCLKSVAMA